MTRKQVAKLIESKSILQAPMAGITTPELVSEVSIQGEIGNIGAGYLAIQSLAQFIQTVKSKTNKVFGVNLFVPEETQVNEEAVKKAKEKIKEITPVYSKDLPDEIKNENIFKEQINLVIKEEVPLVSFTFGLPSSKVIEQLKNADIYVIGTATSVEEALEVEKAGCDAVVAQGSEAGGHRGTFLGDDSLIGLMSLIPQVEDAVKIPIIASGGIMDSRGVKAAYCLGASSVQLGSAFLMTEECSADEVHKTAILNSIETDVVLTKAFSGKLARGIKNDFIKSYKDNSEEILTYPYQNSLTNNLRNLAKKNKDKEFMSLWSGQSVRLSKKQSVEELLKELKK